MQGKLLILSAPSGAGKTSLSRALIEATPDTKMSVSHTTRACRVGEKHEVDYFFIDHVEFQRMIEADEFLEYAQVYDQFYGTGRESVKKMLDNGLNVLLDVDWQGARQVKKLMSEAISVSILPPSREELEKRLYDRGRDPADVIEKRMQQAESEMSHCREADYIILNDDFDLALQDLRYVMQGQADKVRELSIDIESLLEPVVIN
ncbi:MAG: guanylate kinase [Arenicella sp.]